MQLAQGSTGFWRLNAPQYASDYADTYINGQLDHPSALPAVKCERCGETWGGTTILPYKLPPDLQSLQQTAKRLAAFGP